MWPSTSSRVTFMMDGTAAGTGADSGWMDDEDRYKKKSEKMEINNHVLLVDMYKQIMTD